MAVSFQRGFKKKAETLALAVRREMGLEWNERLDPRALAKHVRVPVVELPDLVEFGFPKESLQHLLGHGRSEFSAMLCQRNGFKLIVANPVHSAGRQASNIVHEVAHLLLEHNSNGELLEAGCRRWDQALEDEANWLAGELLVPRTAALDVARRQLEIDTAAEQYGVSIPMMKWRLNHSGARRQAENERRARRRPR